MLGSGRGDFSPAAPLLAAGGEGRRGVGFVNAPEWAFSRRALAVLGAGRPPEDALGLHEGMQSCKAERLGEVGWGGGGLPLPLHGGVCGGADSVIVAGECLRFWGVLLFGAGAGPRGGGSGARRG